MPPSTWARPMVATVRISREDLREPSDDQELGQRADQRAGDQSAATDSGQLQCLPR